MRFVEGITGCRFPFARLTLGNARAGLGQRNSGNVKRTLITVLSLYISLMSASAGDSTHVTPTKVQNDKIVRALKKLPFSDPAEIVIVKMVSAPKAKATKKASKKE